MKPQIKLADWGTMDYAEALERQTAMFEVLVAGKNAAAAPAEGSAKEAAERAAEGSAEVAVAVAEEERSASGGNARSRSGAPEVGSEPCAGWLVFCEHPHVYTLGRSGRAENLLVSEEFLRSKGAALHRTGRGGDITYHGPGQLVVYPILDLERVGLGLRGYIEALEEAVIETVAHFGIEAGRIPGKTGVWVGTGATEKTTFSSKTAESAACGGAERETETNDTPFSSKPACERELRAEAKENPAEVALPMNSERSASTARTLFENPSRPHGARSERFIGNARSRHAGSGVEWETETNKTRFSSVRCRCRADRSFEGEDSTNRTDSTEKRGSAAGAPQSRKLCAIGVRASRGVVMHGLALNVATDLEWFGLINPCGFVGGAVTSMEKETGRKIALEDVKKLLAERIAERLRIRADAEIRKKEKRINI